MLIVQLIGAAAAGTAIYWGVRLLLLAMGIIKK